MMRHSVFLVIVSIVVAVALAAPAAGVRPEGKGKPPKEPVSISLNFEYSGPDELPPADSCVFAQIFSWDAGVKGTFGYEVHGSHGEIVASDAVTFSRPGSKVFFEFSLSPAYVGDEFELRHIAFLRDQKGKLIDEFDETRTLTCNEWHQNP